MRIYVYVGLGAQSKDIKQSENGETLSEESMLMNEEVRYGHEGPKKWSEEECFFDWAKPRSKGTV